MDRIKHKAGAILAPVHFAVAERGPFEAMVQAVQHQPSGHGDDSRFGCLQLDLENASNLFYRLPVLGATRVHQPELWRFNTVTTKMRYEFPKLIQENKK